MSLCQSDCLLHCQLACKLSEPFNSFSTVVKTTGLALECSEFESWLHGTSAVWLWSPTPPHPRIPCNLYLLYFHQSVYDLTFLCVYICTYMCINIWGVSQWCYSCMCLCVLTLSFMSSSLWPHLACQAPLSTQFPRQEYWSGWPFPSPGDLHDPGIQPMSPESPALASGFFTTEPQGSPHRHI